MISINMSDIEIIETINQLKKGGNKFDVNFVKSNFKNQ